MIQSEFVLKNDQFETVEELEDEIELKEILLPSQISGQQNPLSFTESFQIELNLINKSIIKSKSDQVLSKIHM